MDVDGFGNSNNNSENGTRRAKRFCHRHTPEQIQRLEDYFKNCPHPDESQRETLCNELNLEPDQVKFWFQNKRTQSKTQGDKSCNILLRRENERIEFENEAMLEALKNVTCPTCGGPSLGNAEREPNLQKLRLENAKLQEKRDNLTSFIARHKPSGPNMINPLPSVQIQRQQTFDGSSSSVAEQNNVVEPTIMPLSENEIKYLSEVAATAVDELKRLFFAEDIFWVKSAIDESKVINQDNYKKFFHATRHVKGLNARTESSKDDKVVPIEATKLVEMFLDSEKRKDLFPTIVNKVKTIHAFGSDLPIQDKCNVLQVIWERLHILSPLVPPREFMILRCCQQLDVGLWIIADVSHDIQNFVLKGSNCYKRPSGCLIHALSNGYSQVMWIEHVEVDDKSDTHPMYRELLCGSSGYGAKRWLVTLERMCERMALTSILTIPATDWNEMISSGEGKRNVMKLGERMLKHFNEMLTMSGKVDFPQQWRSGVRVSMRMNVGTNQPPGLIVSAASSHFIARTPSQVFDFLRNMDVRRQWDVLSYGNFASEIVRIFTGSNHTNYVSILKPQQENIQTMMTQDAEKTDMMILQDCYIDPLGGMFVYAPIDMNTMKHGISGEIALPDIPILPSGFIISSDGRRSTTATAENGGDSGGGTLFTVAFQILIGGRTGSSTDLAEKTVNAVSSLISTTVQRIKILLNVSE